MLLATIAEQATSANTGKITSVDEYMSALLVCWVQWRHELSL